MKLIFDEAVESKNPIYKFNCAHKISNHGDGLLLQNEVFKDKEDYLLGLNRFLSCMGIAEYQYKILKTNPDEKNTLKLHFFFKNEMDYLQFLAIMSGNKSGYYTRSISSLTPEQSNIREYNILKFIRDNDIKDARIRRSTSTEFDFVGGQLYDYLTVSTHYLKGYFDTRPQAIGTYPEKTLG